MNSEEIKKLQKIGRVPLFAPSLFYAAFVNIKNTLYDKNILKSYSYDGVKIISVGNIAAGGTGKTPVVIKLAEALIKYGKVCVITGNYPTKDKRVNVVSIEGNIFKKPPVVPDEAYMIAKKTKVSVISSKSRKAAIELATGLNINYIILDDALHKRSIKKDTEICVIDSAQPFEDGFYLPAGTLRDSKKSLKRCDFTLCVDKQNAGIRNVKGCHYSYFKNLGIFDKNGNKKDNIKSVFAFCGIGKPEGFLNSLKEAGLEIKGYKFFKDHKVYSKKDMDMLYKLKKDKKAEILVTTYKDFVKIENEDVCYLDVEIIIEGFDKIVEGIR